MITIDKLAQIAYEKQIQAATGRAPHIEWRVLDIKAKAAWIAAVQAVRAEIERY